MGRFRYVGITAVWAIQVSGASFFGPQWIKKTETGISVSANSVSVAPLLQEWCQICKKECVIDHDMKQKLSINLEETSCEVVLEQLSAAVATEAVASGYSFKKQSKGSWAEYHCQNRSAQEVAALLKQVLTPAGKYEHLLADNISSMIWVPKDFYIKHLPLIQSLDTRKAHYMAHLSWLRVNESRQQQYGHDNAHERIQLWLRGNPVEATIQEVFEWLKWLHKSGKVVSVAEMSLLLVENEYTEAKVHEIQQVVKIDKKGIKSLVEIPQVIKVKIFPTKTQPGSLELDVLLEESTVSSESVPYGQTSQNLKAKVPLSIGTSIMIGGVSRQEQVLQKTCLPVLGKVPILEHLFCMRKTRQESRQYARVLTVSDGSIVRT